MTKAQQLDLHSIDDVVTGLYAAISGEPHERDWETIMALFAPDARMVRTRLDDDGKPVAFSFSLEEYRKNASEMLKDAPFYEYEIARRTERFGNIATVFSAYEAKADPKAPELLKRGMNMIHLYDDGEHWWIMHMIWDDEREGLALPADLFEAA